MTARDLGAALARTLSILVALEAVRNLAGTPIYAYGFFDKNGPQRADWMHVLIWTSISAALGFSALLLWVNAGRFWNGASNDQTAFDAHMLQRLALAVLGIYLTVTSAPWLIQTVLVLTMVDTRLGELAQIKYSVWDAIAVGIQLVAGLALWYFNRQPSAVPTPLP